MKKTNNKKNNKNSMKFEILSPKILDKKQQEVSFNTYKNALDFAFENNNVKNIGILGEYSSGKSSIVNTYIKEKKIKNVITISLPEFYQEKSNNENSETQLKKENRIEKQIINQILVQVSPKKIYLSKYSFKRNVKFFKIIFNIFYLLFFFAQLFFGFLKKI